MLQTALISQITGTATIFAWVFFASSMVWVAIRAVIGLRISEEDKYQGGDIAECDMEAYPEFTR